MTLPIRRATAADAPACAAILNDWIDATPWMPRIHSHGDVIRHYRDRVLPKATVMVAGTDAVCGFVAADGPLVTALYLAPDARGRGLGAGLLDAVRDGSQRLWTFVANAPARRFYYRLGFAEIARSDGANEEGLPDILLERGP
ncbi:GNAT family N-acetyltransferase [Jannaschia ovalis]|uniref:GNAT family N-acetyltransferase n=1 Tax=Jannaschia ovalis TaxID=3038773 RepID=A0ABY8LB85_9RHOB|nr:GNAT family N-acetyltransferase [Jannaschia sp. GRR-S6-38]WGH77882.1 GNAT family N-acetyltransferase [Jannaschia sp. GRR-S6-38]